VRAPHGILARRDNGSLCHAEKYENQMHIQRKGGLSNVQMLACLKALVDIFKDEIVEGQ